MRLFWPKVDVHIVGTAFAPHGKPVTEFDVSRELAWSSASTIGSIAQWRKQKRERREKDPFVPPEFTEPEPIADSPV